MSPPITPPTDCQHPKIHTDFVALYARYFAVHEQMSKYLRIAIREQDIPTTLSTMMRLTVHINVMKAAPHRASAGEIAHKLHALPSHAEHVPSFSLFIWQNKILSEGFFLGARTALENIYKPIVGWEKYRTRHLPKI